MYIIIITEKNFAILKNILGIYEKKTTALDIIKRLKKWDKEDSKEYSYIIINLEDINKNDIY